MFTMAMNREPNAFKTLMTFLLLIVAVLGLAGCGSTGAYKWKPVKTFDPDTLSFDAPEEKAQYQYWDRIDNSIFHQLEKPLDLNKTFRFIGRMIGVAGPRQADNINRLDEVPESSWYERRHYYEPMTGRELARGPNTVRPDTSGSWTIFRGKLEGANSGFFIEDARGNRFLIKFDGYLYPELTTAADVIGSKFFYAAGYHVPEAVITYFDPEKVQIGEGVNVTVDGRKVPMDKGHLEQILQGRPKNENGKIRAMASKFVDGRPVGPWFFEGTRDDDPNDRVKHEHRRELRGMRVLSSWLNDTDRRDANTMAVYVEEGYIKHLVQDFGNVLGANGVKAHTPIYGQAYLIDLRYILFSTITLGGYVYPWQNMDGEVTYPAAGYFRADVFKPGRWVPVHPIPAFENMTLRDAFWGAKQVTSFSDSDIRAIVETGQITNPKAENYLVKTLIKRRDKIARYWYKRINPLDRFRVGYHEERLELRFSDLGVITGVFDKQGTRYNVEVYAGGDKKEEVTTARLPISLDRKKLGLDSKSTNTKTRKIKMVLHTLRSERDGQGKRITLYLMGNSNRIQLSKLEREE